MPGDQDLVASDASEGATPKPVHHVSVKPPPFMESAVPGWFAIMDAQFHIAKITSAQTKFYHVLSSLPPETISHIPQDVLEQKDFKVLQETVTDMYEKTKPELFERLISKTRLTGRPSHFLSELREMGDKAGVGDELIRHKFLQSLPSGIAAALGSHREMSLSQLGKLADELVPLVQGTFAAVNVAPAEGDLSQAVVNPYQPQFQQSVSHPVPCHLTSHQPQQYGQDRRRGLPPPRGFSAPRMNTGLMPFHEGQRPRVCRAHLYYGARARWCKPWCVWPTKGTDLRMQPSSRSASPARAPSPQEN